MKKLLALAGAAVVFAAGVLHAQVTNLDDLNYWGTGPNRTGLIIYWNDSKSPNAIAWGYQWSGNQTVADMLLFLASNDPLLFLRIDSSTGFGLAVFGIGYQVGSSPFGVTGAQDTAGNPVTPVFSSGVDDLDTNPSTTQAPASSTAAAPTNAVDHYVEGWNDNGYWELFHSGSDNLALQPSSTLPTVWTSSWVGSSVPLVHNAWAAFSFASGFSSVPPAGSVVAAIPEPSVLLLAASGGIWLLFFHARKRLHAA